MILKSRDGLLIEKSNPLTMLLGQVIVSLLCYKLVKKAPQAAEYPIIADSITNHLLTLMKCLKYQQF